MSINTNNSDYAIRTDSDFAELLRYFNNDFIKGVVETNIENNFRPFVQTIPNLIKSYELMFKDKLIEFPDKRNEIDDLRRDVYMMVIDTICNKFDLSINSEVDFDPFSLAMYMYDFFISNFTQNIIFFFTNYIIKEKKSIYNDYKLIDFKKNKDSSTLHAKKMYDDPELMAIIPNAGYILNNMRGLDISLSSILTNIFSYPEPATFVSTTIQDKGDFFKNHYCIFCSGDNEHNPPFITLIKLELQKNINVNMTASSIMQ